MIKTSLVRKVFFQSTENIKDQINALAYTFPHSHNVVFAGYSNRQAKIRLKFPGLLQVQNIR